MTRKKHRNRKSQKRRPSGSGIIRRALVGTLLFAFGLTLGVLGPWVWWLDREAGLRFADRQFSQATRVYARPLELYDGLAVRLDDLFIELEAAGLREGNPVEVGRYARNGSRLDVHLPGFAFPDGRQDARRVQLAVESGRLRLDGAPDSALLRLPPAEIGSLMPLDDRDRTLVALADFPPLLVTGVQAVEDRQFRHHHGLDPRGMLRAAWINLRHGRVTQGGSTITQQLVKNLFLTPERSFLRKFNEAVMALSLERRFSKAEILEAYLNEVYLGQDGAHAIHGFGRASEYYFGLPVQALDAGQVALLVGMARGASWYHPVRNPERARVRRNQVLGMFLETGLIDQADHDRLVESALGVSPASVRGSTRHASFLDLVRRQLRADYRDRDLRGTGLRVFTTLSPSAQHRAEQALSNALARVENEPGELQGAIVLAEPATGDLRALVGDRHPRRAGFNRALDARRSVGSVIKPFLYLIALADPDNHTLVTPLLDEPLSVPIPGGEPWQPRNHDGNSHGSVPLMEALTMSHNQATVRLGLEIGVAPLLRLLEQLGVVPGTDPHPSVFLGSLSLSPLQITQLYQPLAAEGYSTPLKGISEVVDAEGQSIGRYPMRLRPIREREALALLDFALRRVVTHGTGRSLANLLPEDPGIRGKTGTTNDRRDAWFVGYTRDWLGVVWVGRDDHAPAGIGGASAALPVWAELFAGLPARSGQAGWPEGIEWYWIDWPEPLLASESCDGAQAVPFAAGSQPEALSPCMNADTGRRPFWRR
ncbi:penicillin-binding protein 1B [Wenzhouxiangella sp. AB-CW3]|uniref:penicillin-binding protein 1B n=1 Tax=Wenzhouxiangella sp. AB-CW3 TaxID=2771012 RepID=UPI00168B9923|nr:penicillin-binding protein 1B [Wenzhouxiangella sp. AB-CW3]QOC21893.1 penicillin-binding protein 1B [Wenzhouxiangella sp. AB-CW3]